MNRTEIICNARLVDVTVGKMKASERVLRSVLLALANHEGKPVPSHRLKHDSDLGERTIWLGIKALEQIGLVQVTPGKPNTYHIRWDRLTPGAGHSRAPSHPSSPKPLPSKVPA